VPVQTTIETPNVNLPPAEPDDVAKAMQMLAKLHRRLKDFPPDLRVWIANNLYVLTNREHPGIT
jgi:hypothetical protein